MWSPVCHTVANCSCHLALCFSLSVTTQPFSWVTGVVYCTVLPVLDVDSFVADSRPVLDVDSFVADSRPVLDVDSFVADSRPVLDVDSFVADSRPVLDVDSFVADSRPVLDVDSFVADSRPVTFQHSTSSLVSVSKSSRAQ